MSTLVSRRAVLAALAAGAACASSAGCHRRVGAGARLADIEQRLGGRLGVTILDTRNDARISRRADERFAMCSTFKWVLAAAVLARVDRRVLALEQRVAFSRGDLLEYAPVTRAHRNEGAMTLEALCAAAVEVSDNTAANLLLAQIGGPAGLTAWVRGVGDATTRLDRGEPALNENTPGDARDTTTPAAMVALLQRVALGDALTPPSRERLTAWMRRCSTGAERLRAGLPAGWEVANKTGTGAGAFNDVAIAWPPARPPVLIAAYADAHAASGAAGARALAEVGRVAASAAG